ncbi:MAG: hypothetical protein JWO90_633 [Solirubrobacterales bacterium]|jgi:hypothetical protein|nr:hypothetical protein [Solirubrobacterales bacterium]
MRPTPTDHLLHALLGDDPATVAAVADAAESSEDPVVLVAAALCATDGDVLLVRARAVATTTRDRQLVAIAAAHVRGDRDLVDALAREHLVDHPDSVLASWIACAQRRTSASTQPNPVKE